MPDIGSIRGRFCTPPAQQAGMKGDSAAIVARRCRNHLDGAAVLVSCPHD
jgi:hypothetical protein